MKFFLQAKFIKSVLSKKIICLTLPIFFSVLFAGNAFATTYYSKSTGNLDVLSNWGTNTDGTGTAPTSFTTTATYIIQNNLTPTIGAAWSVGTNSVTVGNGSAAVLQVL